MASGGDGREHPVGVTVIGCSRRVGRSSVPARRCRRDRCDADARPGSRRPCASTRCPEPHPSRSAAVGSAGCGEADGEHEVVIVEQHRQRLPSRRRSAPARARGRERGMRGPAGHAASRSTTGGTSSRARECWSRRRFSYAVCRDPALISARRCARPCAWPSPASRASSPARSRPRPLRRRTCTLASGPDRSSVVSSSGAGRSSGTPGDTRRAGSPGPRRSASWKQEKCGRRAWCTEHSRPVARSSAMQVIRTACVITPHGSTASRAGSAHHVERCGCGLPRVEAVCVPGRRTSRPRRP